MDFGRTTGAEDLRRCAGRVNDAKQARRLLALAAIYDGKDRADRSGSRGPDTLEGFGVK